MHLRADFCSLSSQRPIQPRKGGKVASFHHAGEIFCLGAAFGREKPSTARVP
jgi:hypothetical protein